MDKITASLATIPRRIGPLKEMIDSIINQVDVLQIYLNGFEKNQIPSYLLKENKIKLYMSQEEEFGDRGDAGKFFNVQNIKDWHFICDDDIHYPKDYVETMIEKCLYYNCEYVIGNHGGDFNKFPILDSYKDRRRTVHYKKSKLFNDIAVHYLATNSICFHDKTIRLNDMEDFKIANMGDIWLAVACQKEEVGMICQSHDFNWIVDCKNYDVWDSIYGHRNNTNAPGNVLVQTEVSNTISNWKHHVDLDKYPYLKEYHHEFLRKKK